LAPPIFRVVAPKAFERTMRMLEPPMETWTISRRVVSSEKWLLPLLAETGEVDQVPTQWSGLELAAAALEAMKGIRSKDGRKCRAERRIVRAIWCQV
jgi:hypothetical protein